MSDISPPRTVDDECETQTVISVQDVSKTYMIWSDPTVRLTYSLVKLVLKLERLLPNSIVKRLRERLDTAFREHHALHDVSFDVQQGESWGVIGYNGSGKSTLLKIISGNMRPSKGRVEVQGKVAILDYSAGLSGEFTGKENIFLKAAMHGLTRKQINERYQAIADFADIGDFIDQPVKIYSSGMVARLGFAIMSHIDADILITDEALAVGDALFVQKSMRFLRSFLKQGTFIFVSHSINDVVSLCENAIWLDKGELRAIGTSKEVSEAYMASVAMRKASLSTTPNEIFDEQDDAADSNVRSIAQPHISVRMNSRPAKTYHDPRLEFLNRSPWRNDVKIPAFDSEQSSFGVGGAKITDVLMEDETGAALSWVIGAEVVHLRIEVQAERGLPSPIVGFQVKDRLGQVLFADNTGISTVDAPFPVTAGGLFSATFVFQMPLLPAGDYVVRAAVAAGSDAEATMLHCIDDALVMNCVTAGARHGLVGVPMQEIRLEKHV
jgi:lipopolysaccharide transport system ATP-binding protein